MTAIPGQVDLLNVDMFATGGTPRTGPGGGQDRPPGTSGHAGSSPRGREASQPQGSPCKRRGVGQETRVTVDMLKDMLADQTKTLLQHQQNSQNELKREIRADQKT